MKYLLPVFALALVGCIHAPQAGLGVTPGVPPPSPAQVSQCESLRTWHNVWTILGTISGAGAGAQGSIDAVVTDKNAQIGVGIGAASFGVLAGISAVAAGIDSDNYALHNCNDVLTRAYSQTVVSPNPAP